MVVKFEVRSDKISAKVNGKTWTEPVEISRYDKIVIDDSSELDVRYLYGELDAIYEDSTLVVTDEITSCALETGITICIGTKNCIWIGVKGRGTQTPYEHAFVDDEEDNEENPEPQMIYVQKNGILDHIAENLGKYCNIIWLVYMVVMILIFVIVIGYTLFEIAGRFRPTYYGSVRRML